MNMLVLHALALVGARAQAPSVPPPPIPRLVACGGGAAGAHHLSWAPLPTADVYEVEVSATDSAATPLASTTTSTPTVAFAGLNASQTWWFKVRAHAKSGTSIGTDVEWSDFSAPISCKAGGAELPPAAEAARAASGAPSRFTMMYRISEVWGGRLWGREYAPPDFLSSHDSADGPGSSSFLTFAQLSLMSASEVSLSGRIFRC